MLTKQERLRKAFALSLMGRMRSKGIQRSDERTEWDGPTEALQKANLCVAFVRSMVNSFMIC